MIKEYDSVILKRDLPEQQLEQGDVPLDESITLYERGEKLRAACQNRLDAAQARIEKIVTDASGKPTGTVPLDETR